MSTVQERDPVHEAKLNLGLQVALALPFLVIFGFTVLNVALTIGFLIMAAVRLMYPYNERPRRGELYASIGIFVLWVALQVI